MRRVIYRVRVVSYYIRVKIYSYKFNRLNFHVEICIDSYHINFNFVLSCDVIFMSQYIYLNPTY